MFNRILGMFSKDLAIDLGTANTLVFVRGKGIVINEPSVVVVREKDNKVLAIGREAKKMLGRTPAGVVAIRPMKDGVIADFEITKLMIQYFIKKAHNRQRLLRPKCTICIPTGITQVERRAVIDSALQSGVREVFLVEEPMAAAIGTGIPIHEASGNMVVDIGGGTTDVAVISMAGIVASKSIRVAGDEMDDVIVQYIKRKHNLLLGHATAEIIKKEIASAFPFNEEKTMEVKGRDVSTGIPKNLIINDTEIREVIREPVMAIIAAIRDVLDRTPPELGADIVDNGIVLAGGGSLLAQLDLLVTKETELPTTIPENPELCVVIGTGKVMEDHENLKGVIVN